MNILRAGRGEAVPLADLVRNSFHDVAGRFGLNPTNCPRHPSNCRPEDIVADFDRNRIFYVGHELEPVGCVAIARAASDARLWYIEKLGVVPHKRGKGFGTELMRYALEQIHARRGAVVSIGIISDDVFLKGWYEKLGFRSAETKEFDHLPFVVALMRYEFDRC